METNSLEGIDAVKGVRLHESAPQPATLIYRYFSISLQALALLPHEEVDEALAQGTTGEEHDSAEDDLIPLEELEQEEQGEPLNAPSKIYDSVWRRLVAEDPHGRAADIAAEPSKRKRRKAKRMSRQSFGQDPQEWIRVEARRLCCRISAPPDVKIIII